MQAAFASIATRLDGEVEVTLSRGTATTTDVGAPTPLLEDFATFGEDDVYDRPAEGFIRLHTLPSRIATLKTLAEGGDPLPAATEGASA